MVEQHLAALRKSFRLAATPTDFAETPLPQRTLSQEELWLELEADTCRALAHQRAETRLSCPQRRWLGALRTAARDGAFFESSAQLNLSAASRLLGKNRSSALRAYNELQTRFRRELERFE